MPSSPCFGFISAAVTKHTGKMQPGEGTGRDLGHLRVPGYTHSPQSREVTVQEPEAARQNCVCIFVSDLGSGCEMIHFLVPIVMCSNLESETPGK